MAKAKKKAAKKTSKKTPAKASVKKAAKKVATKAKTAVKSAVKKVVKKATASKEYKLKVGDKSPSFDAPATSGRNISLGALKGKNVVLYFYPKDNTPGCTLEGQDFKRLAKEFEKAGTEIVGVSQDSIASHEKFKSKCGFPFDLLTDDDGSICKSFDVIQMKNMYGREFEGIERSTFVIGKDGEIKAEWRKVRVEGHAQEVLDTVRGL